MQQIEIAKHVTSPELSQRLAALGVPQKSIFWHRWSKNAPIETSLVVDYFATTDICYTVSAFLATELGKVLEKVPSRLRMQAYLRVMHLTPALVLADDVFMNALTPDIPGEVLADLIKNELIDVKSL